MALARAVCGFGMALAKPLPSLFHAREMLGDTFIIRLFNAGRAEHDHDSVTTFWQRYLSSPGTCIPMPLRAQPRHGPASCTALILLKKIWHQKYCLLHHTHRLVLIVVSLVEKSTDQDSKINSKIFASVEQDHYRK